MMRLTSICLLLLAALVSAQNRRVIQGGQRRPPNRRRPQGNQDTRLGLLANQLGVAPVPGGTIGSPVGGIFNNVPGGANSLSRDDGCWCQAINQVCTPLRPQNLDLVTRIVNLPGSPGSPQSPTTGCASDEKVCCLPQAGVPVSGVTVAPSHNAGLTQLGRCGVRHSHQIGSAISPTADLNEYPWMAVIMGPGFSYVAGGVLISDSWVLTAPHKLKQTQSLTVRLGDYDVGDPNDVAHYEVPVSQVVIHPQYNPQTLANDVALLKLATPIPLARFPHITPACIPSQGQIFHGQRCFVSGWGKNAFNIGNHQRKLQEVDVPVIDSFRCQSLLRQTRLGPGFNLDTNSFMCAGGEPNKDACQGDGGSPLVCGGGGQGWTVAGLVAWGVGCGQPNVPAAYVNIPSYSNFIRQYVGF